MPSPRQLNRARQRFARLLPDRATIQRPTVTPDGGGGQETVYNDHAVQVPCRLSPAGGGEQSGGTAGRTRGDRIASEADAVITFEAGADVEPEDRIVIADQAFDVQLVRHRGEFRLTTRCEVREIGGV